MSIADDCRTLLRALPASMKDPAAHYPRDAAARLWTDLRNFPSDVDNAALAAGVDLWPAVERLAAIVARPRSWPEHAEWIAADLAAIAAACDGQPVPVAPAVPAAQAPAEAAAFAVSLTEGQAESPAALALAVPGRLFDVGCMYGKAAAWLRELDATLAERLDTIGHALRAPKTRADDAYRAAVGDGMRPDRKAQAQLFHNGARLLEAHAQSLPPELVEWAAARLRATADALANLEDKKPANAVLRALGAAREGQRGRPAADHLQDARDCWLVWEAEYQRRLHPDLPLQAEDDCIFERVANLWSIERLRVSPAVVAAAWRRRHLFLN